MNCGGYYTVNIPGNPIRTLAHVETFQIPREYENNFESRLNRK